MNALELVGVTAGYGPYRALDEVSLSVPDGGIVALVGPNGAGKSTVARVCAGLFARLSVAENLELSFGRWLGPSAAATALERTFDGFPMLAERRTQPAGTLSGGQQRLLSLAKVLGDSPRVVVADELSLGLSPAAVEDIYLQLRVLHAAGTALLVIEQQTDRVLGLADRAVVLDRGVVAFTGPPDGASPVVRRMLGATAAPDSLAEPVSPA